MQLASLSITIVHLCKHSVDRPCPLSVNCQLWQNSGTKISAISQNLCKSGFELAVTCGWELFFALLSSCPHAARETRNTTQHNTPGVVIQSVPSVQIQRRDYYVVQIENNQSAASVIQSQSNQISHRRQRFCDCDCDWFMDYSWSVIMYSVLCHTNE